MKNNIIYEQVNHNTECIFYKDVAQSYPLHTHANHITYGFILDGVVSMVFAGEKQFCRAGECFYILPDIPHAIENVNGTAYSMLCICVSTGKTPEEIGKEISYAKKLKQLILDAPENTFFIKDMAKSIGISPYHMIRKFKEICGLTPHQFQIQCRIRKAQKLLEEDKSVTEAACATGFCDQSHFDRCFHKIVRLTPGEYKQSVKLSGTVR